MALRGPTGNKQREYNYEYGYNNRWKQDWISGSYGIDVEMGFTTANNRTTDTPPYAYDNSGNLTQNHQYTSSNSLPFGPCIFTPSVYVNRVNNKFTNFSAAYQTMAIGTATAHEIVHRIAGIRHPSVVDTNGPNLMNPPTFASSVAMGSPPQQNPYSRLTAEQIEQLYKKCLENQEK